LTSKAEFDKANLGTSLNEKVICLMDWKNAQKSFNESHGSEKARTEAQNYGHQHQSLYKVVM
jgi:hypothetical protein